MAISTYAELKTALSSWVERAADTSYVGEVDTFIDMAEANFNRLLTSHHEMDATTTLTLDSNGVTTLPADYLAYRSAIWDGAADLPLSYMAWASLQAHNPFNTSGVPVYFSIRGTTLKVAPVAEGANLAFNYTAKLAALSDSNTTNWLLDLAPDAYLFMGLAMGHAFNENEVKAAGMEAKAKQILQEVFNLGQLAQFNYTGVTLDMPTP